VAGSSFRLRFLNARAKLPEFIDLGAYPFDSAVVTLASATGSELAARVATVALLWMGAGLVIDRAMTPGALMSCYALLGYLTGPLGRLIAMNRTVQDALIASDRLFEIMDLELEETGARMQLTREMAGDVRLEGVSVRYGGRARVLTDVTLVAPRGALTAIVGESGSGKSTLAAVLHRVHPLESGRVRIGEHDAAHVSLESLRQLVGVVPQRVDLFSGTLLENVAVGDLAPDPRRVVELCRLLGLADFVEALPHGYHTALGERGMALSGGQAQRVAIARALDRDPEVLVLDEATAALDAVAEHHVLGAVRQRAAAGKAVIVIAHRLSTVVHADNIVVLEGGRVAEQGPHAELLRRGGAYARLWAHQFPLLASAEVT
jgi:ATP-binding cassette subfamily B protein